MVSSCIRHGRLGVLMFKCLLRCGNFSIEKQSAQEYSMHSSTKLSRANGCGKWVSESNEKEESSSSPKLDDRIHES